jgi:hypothetical protein
MVTIDKSGANLAAIEAINNDRETPIKIRQSKFSTIGSVSLSRLRRKDGRKKRPSGHVGRILGDFGEFAPGNESHRELCAIE